MNYKTTLEIRPHSPIEIPQGELILPIPREWFDLIALYDFPAAQRIGSLLHGGGNDLREDIESIFHALGAYEIPVTDEAETIDLKVLMRQDVLECLQAAADAVNRTPHEVACRILAKFMPPPGDEPLLLSRHSGSSDPLTESFLSRPPRHVCP